MYEAIFEEVMSMPEDTPSWKEIAHLFEKGCNLRRWLNALNGKNVSIMNLVKERSIYLQEVLLYHPHGIGRCKLLDDFWWDGSTSDIVIFNACSLSEGIDGDHVHWSGPDPLPNIVETMLYFIVGDEAFTSKTWLMKP